MSSVKYPEFPARRSSKKKKRFRNLASGTGYGEFPAPFKRVWNGTSRCRRLWLHIYFDCSFSHQKAPCGISLPSQKQEPFRLPREHPVLFLHLSADKEAIPTGLHSCEQPSDEPPALQLYCWRCWGLVCLFVFKCKYLKASVVWTKPSESENLIIFQLTKTSLQQTLKRPPRIKNISSVEQTSVFVIDLNSSTTSLQKKSLQRIHAFNQSFIKQISILSEKNGYI